MFIGKFLNIKRKILPKIWLHPKGPRATTKALNYSAKIKYSALESHDYN